MADKRLVRYIKKTLDQGHKPEQIKRFLLKNKYSAKEVDNAFKSLKPKKSSNGYLYVAVAMVVVMSIYFVVFPGEPQEIDEDMQSTYVYCDDAACLEENIAGCEKTKAILPSLLGEPDVGITVEGEIDSSCSLAFSFNEGTLTCEVPLESVSDYIEYLETSSCEGYIPKQGCDDLVCFEEHVRDCTVETVTEENITYAVQGRDDDVCIVSVLSGEDAMVCNIPINFTRLDSYIFGNMTDESCQGNLAQT